MDALALLCNLHAEGPRTLQRLRRIGCESLQALSGLDLEALAQELDGDEAAATRFKREGQQLNGRLEANEIPTEAEHPIPLGTAPSSEAARAIAPSGEEPPTPRDASSLAGAPKEAQAEIGRLLETWRALDHNEPPGAPTEYIVPRPAETLPNRALDEIALDGLSATLVARFAEVGILSLRGLIEAEALVLAKQVGTSFTHVKRLQFLSRRASVRYAEEDAADVARGPEVEPNRLDTAGPFA